MQVHWCRLLDRGASTRFLELIRMLEGIQVCGTKVDCQCQMRIALSETRSVTFTTAARRRVVAFIVVFIARLIVMLGFIMTLGFIVAKGIQTGTRGQRWW